MRVTPAQKRMLSEIAATPGGEGCPPNARARETARLLVLRGLLRQTDFSRHPWFVITAAGREVIAPKETEA